MLLETYHGCKYLLATFLNGDTVDGSSISPNVCINACNHIVEEEHIMYQAQPWQLVRRALADCIFLALPITRRMCSEHPAKMIS